MQMKKDMPSFETKDEQFKWLKDNKKVLEAEKKFEMKRADGISFHVEAVNEDDAEDHESTHKAASGAPKVISESATKLRAKLTINATKLMDSHLDVHIDGLWKKSLQEIGLLYHLQEHKMGFATIISDEVNAYTKTMNWADLGAPYEGKTQALVFDSVMHKERNPFMFEQYRKGYVKNHSVGMRYVKLFMCINSEEKYYAEEKANWDKYFPEVANKEMAEEYGYFWAVTEAKIVEGSAVPMGSCWVTPTQSIEDISDKSAAEIESDKQANNEEPPLGTPAPNTEPPTGTQPEQVKRIINVNLI